MKHPFVAQFHEPAKEKVSSKIIDIPISDQKKLTIKEYREALYSDILKKKKEQRKKWQMAYLKQLGINVAEEQKAENQPFEMNKKAVNGSRMEKSTKDTAGGSRMGARAEETPNVDEKYSKYSKPVSKGATAQAGTQNKAGAGGSMQYQEYLNGLFKGKS